MDAGLGSPTRLEHLLLVNAMLGQFITGFAGRSFVVALPTIANTLHADILGISWAIIAYQLAGISLSVVFGRLGDIHGRYAIYGTGFAIMAGARSSAAWRRASCGSIRDILPIGLTPNDPRGSVRICPVSRRRAMTPIVVPANKRLQLPGRVHVPI